MKTIEELWQKVSLIELVQVRPSEMEAMYKHCFEFTEPYIVEIGSAHGASSTIFADAAQELGGVLHCYDTYPEDYYNQDKFGLYAKKAFIKNMKDYEDSYILHQASSDEVINSVLGNNIDILFIDGMHSYEAVKQDCLNLLPFLRSGGYVGFHDYNNVAFEVKRAADEFCSDWAAESIWDLAIFKKP